MQRVTITNRGLSLLASSSEATGQYYWLGYYALAYVPSIWKNEEVEFPSNGQECLNVNGEQNIESTDTDQISPAMTRLTKYGDMIYNIWQGSSAKTATANPEEPTSFYTDIKRFYRYVLDENGNNTLVAWTIDETDDAGNPIYIGKHVYRGTDGYTKSTMYIPAPLYYLGDTYGRLSTSNYFKELPSFEETSGVTGNGSDIYPYMEVTLSDGSTELTVPEVTVDYRAYKDSAGTESSYETYNVPSQYFDSKGILPEVTGSLDSTSWVAAKWTLTPDFDPSGDFSVVCSEFWKLWSISNYNRYNAPAGSIGTSMSSEFNTRNFSKLTKFFPIESYNVVSSERGISASGGNVEVATALKLGISINLSSRMENDARQYDRSGMSEQHPSVLVDGTETPKDENGKNIFESTHVSFKFNRIGIYAVPVMKAPVVNGKGSGEIAGKNVTLQYQIDPDGEPVLFAVIDWDNTITLSDTGDGIHEFEAEFNVNLEAPDGSVDSSLVRDTSIFYNIYQTPELKWYQNQLIATASTANAITELGLELAAMRTRMDALNTVCCALPEKSGDGNNGDVGSGYLRNLKDAARATDGGLRGVDTLEEKDGYELGVDSIALGTGTGAAGRASSVLGGTNNIIDSGSGNSAIINGMQNEIDGSLQSSILGGFNNKIDISVDASILNGVSNEIVTGGNDSSIISGGLNVVSTSLYSVIAGSYSSSLHDAASVSGIFASEMSDISGPMNNSYAYVQTGGAPTSNNSAILGGYWNHISRGIGTTIIGGYVNCIGSGSSSADVVSSTIIGGNNNNIINGQNDFSAIIAGRQNVINKTAGYSIIVGGWGNAISSGSNSYVNGGYNSIFSGNSNTIYGTSNNSIVAGGLLNVISNSGSYNGIISGEKNSIRGSANSVVSGGFFNVISTTGSHNGIFSGDENTITQGGKGNGYAPGTGGADSVASSIFGGENNCVNGASYSSIVGGQSNYIGYADVLSSATASVGSAVVGGYHNYIYGDDNFIGSSSNANAYGKFITILGSSDDGSGTYLNASGNYSTILGSTDVLSTGMRSTIIGSHTINCSGTGSTVIGSGWTNSSGDYSTVIGSNYVKSTDSYELVYSGEYDYEMARLIVDDAHSSIYSFSGVGNVTYGSNYCYADVQMYHHKDGLLKLKPNSAYSCVATVTGVYSGGQNDAIGNQLSNMCGYANGSEGALVGGVNSVVYTKIFAFTVITNADGRVMMTCSSSGSATDGNRHVRTGTFKFFEPGSSSGPAEYTATRGSTLYAGCAGWQPTIPGWESQIYVATDITPDASGSGSMKTDTSIMFQARFYLPGVESGPSRSMFARAKLECEKIVAIPQTSN